MNPTQQLRDVSSWSEGWLRVFLETAVDSIVLIDSRGRIESFNPAAERMFGYRRAEVLGKNVNVLMPAPYASEHDGYLANFLRTREKKIIGIGREIEAVRRDGTIFPAHLSVAELELEGEIRFAGILRDLTEERAGRAREADLARILDTSLNEIFIFDADTLCFVRVNDGARTNLGFSIDELHGMTPLDIKPTLTEEAFLDLIQPLRDGTRERITFSTHHRRKDRSTYPVEVHLQLSRFAGRRAFVAIIVDTTERDRLQGEFLHAQKLEAVGRLSGALAHDFNNLLMGVISGCRMVDRMLGEHPAAKDLLAEIQKEAHSGAGITRQLLDFSRKGSFETKPCDLAAIVQDDQPMLRKLLGEDVTLSLEIDTDRTTMLADQGKIEQILMNLVVNARDAMPRGGHLEIRVGAPVSMKQGLNRDSHDHVMLSVSDTGCGMDEATRAQVFEPFFTTKGLGKGTGLGLSTVFGLTQEFHGHIEIDSEPGEGTTFRLCFPLTKESACSESQPAGDPAPGGSETILVVEDATLVRAGIRSLLQERGYEVLAAAAADAALEILRETPRIDLMLTDIVMPGMSGPALAEVAKRTHPEMIILFMSAFSDEALVEQGRLQSGMSVLEKPFEEEELARRVRELLASRSAT